jgi:two-component system, NarL family, nitrate/nitrite response regulator NarL
VTVTTIRVLLADSRPLVRAGIARLVRQRVRYRLVAELDDGWAALEAIAALRPDVAVLEAELPGLSADRVLNAVMRDGLATRVVIVPAEDRADRAYAALEAGACAYLTARATEEILDDALSRAARGEAMIPLQLQTGVAREIQLRRANDRPAVTGRELAVLRGIADGLLLPEIARDMHLSRATVKTHAAHLYEKLGVSDRAAAVRQGMRRGLIE